MGTFSFRKAEKRRSKLRLAIFGPAGAGKTFSALRIASGLGEKIAVIDTEHGSSEKYGDRFAFDVLVLDRPNIATYTAALNAAAEAGYDVVILDSLTHPWQELLAEVDALAKAKYRGNTWSAWSEGTPKQRSLVNAILRHPAHIIATMRARTEWTTEEVGGKRKPVRVGLAPEQGKGIEYEFDMLMQINPDHTAMVLKDRTGRFQDALIEMPDEKLGEQLKEWLESGNVPTPTTKTQPKPTPEPTRPYTPSELRAAIRKAADALDGKPLTDGDRKRAVIADIIATAVPEGGEEFLAWLIGEENPRMLTDAETAALWRWLKPEQDESGWLPDATALEEIRLVLETDAE